MDADSQKEVNILLGHLEELWRQLDAVFAGFSAEDWGNQHGQDWVYSDIPFHMVYYDNVIATNLEQGVGLAKDLQIEYRTVKELNVWNAEMFASRAKDISLEAELADYEKVKNRIRKVMGEMNDADLDEMAWYRNMMFRGWRTKRWVIGMLTFHTLDHLLEIRARLATDEFRPSAETVNAGMKALVENVLSGFMHHNRKAVPGNDFKIVSEFLGVGGGSWTHTCSTEGIRVAEGGDATADVFVSMTPETFTLIIKGLLNPMAAMESGDLKVSDVDNFMVYGALTGFPSEDDFNEIYALLP